MNELDTELMVLTVLSVLLWGLAFIYNQPFATGVFAAIIALLVTRKVPEAHPAAIVRVAQIQRKQITQPLRGTECGVQEVFCFASQGLPTRASHRGLIAASELAQAPAVPPQ